MRSIDALRVLLELDPHPDFRPKAGVKRVITFLRSPLASRVALPVRLSRARILALVGREAFTVYERDPKGPVFMTLIEKTFGKEQTTRTWETVGKVAR